MSHAATRFSYLSSKVTGQAAVRAGASGILRLSGTRAHERHFPMQIDPIQQRPRDPLPVVFDLPGGAAALAFGIAIKPAGARVPFWVAIA